jgi:hypothetical protein
VKYQPLLFAFLAYTLLAATSALGDKDFPEHLIPPGYKPEPTRDELGMWMEFQDFERKLNQSAMLVRDSDINDYILEIVCRTADEYCEDIRTYIIRNPNFNASMTATGIMQIWTGLIVRANSTDEIAAVVGHEIAHYTRLHSLQRMRAINTKMTAGSIFDIAVLLATGVNPSLGQMTALMSVLSFNRNQETEADILGMQLIANAAYDPHASYRVWQHIVEEEAAAAVKSRKPGIFAGTHPTSVKRSEYLNDLVLTTYGPPALKATTDDKLLGILNKHYLFLMEDQIDTNRFGRTEEILKRHQAMGVEPGLVLYFYGEMYRQRGEEGDLDLAIESYYYSIKTGSAPAESYKNLGYLYLKVGDTNAAQREFKTYLELEPNGSDRAMIEFYLEE